MFVYCLCKKYNKVWYKEGKPQWKFIRQKVNTTFKLDIHSSKTFPTPKNIRVLTIFNNPFNYYIIK